MASFEPSRSDLDESATLLQKAIGLEPRLLGAHLTLAQVYALQGKPDLALGMFRRALELDPSNATARLALARSETEKGNFQRSLDLAAPVLPAFKQSPDGLFVLATNYLKTANRARAVDLVKDWRQLSGVPSGVVDTDSRCSLSKRTRSPKRSTSSSARG